MNTKYVGQICKFYGTSNGCMRGNKCKYLHINQQVNDDQICTYIEFFKNMTNEQLTSAKIALQIVETDKNMLVEDRSILSEHLKQKPNDTNLVLWHTIEKLSKVLYTGNDASLDQILNKFSIDEREYITSMALQLLSSK